MCFSYTFLIREFWKVPKTQGSSLPVLRLRVVCLPPHDHYCSPGAAGPPGAWHRPHCGPLPPAAPLSPHGKSHTARGGLPSSPSLVTGVENVRLGGCVIEHSYQVQFSFHPCSPCSLKNGVLMSNVKADEAFHVL